MALPTTSAELRTKVPQAPVDPNIVIPKAVRDAATRSEAIQRAVTGQAEPPVIPPNGQAAPLPPNGQEPTPAAPPPVVVAPPPSVVAQPPTPVPPQPGDAEIPPDEWRLRYLAMQGRHDRLAEQVTQMSDTVQRLQHENASMRSVERPAPLAEPLNLITEQELQDYGPDFIDVVRRAAAEIAGPLQAEVQELRGRLGSVQTEAGNSFLTRMHATIGGLVPNWQELNKHPAFIQWVQLPDMFSGAIRQQLMQDAWNSGDANRVAAFFRAFLAEEAAVDPQRGTRVAPQPSAHQSPPAAVPGVTLGTRLSLDQLAAPGRAQSSAHMPADKPVYTAQDITRFYTEVAAGKWRTREADRAAIDADIIAAQHEGRIIPDPRTTRPWDWGGGKT